MSSLKEAKTPVRLSDTELVSEYLKLKKKLKTLQKSHSKVEESTCLSVGLQPHREKRETRESRKEKENKDQKYVREGKESRQQKSQKYASVKEQQPEQERGERRRKKSKLSKSTVRSKQAEVVEFHINLVNKESQNKKILKSLSKSIDARDNFKQKMKIINLNLSTNTNQVQ